MDKDERNLRTPRRKLDKHLREFVAFKLCIPIGFPTKFRFTFHCKKCNNLIPIEPEEIIRHAESVGEAYESLTVFVKNVEPRTIKCQCGYEDEYCAEDVGLFPVDYVPPWVTRASR